MDVGEYLRRIGLSQQPPASADGLRRLHRAHLFSVPFENLDITMGRPIVLSLPGLYEKIVSRRRGGFCYELNGLFGWLLGELGFTVQMLSARVFSDETPGPDFDHMLLLVGLGEGVVADVGFGDSFVDPLPLQAGQEHFEQGRGYRLMARGEVWDYFARERDSSWQPQYRFTRQPRRLEEFNEMCRYQQSSPDSTFTKKSVCSRATREGRITLSGARLITTSSGIRQEGRVESAEQYRSLLRQHFGIDLGDAADVQRLWQFLGLH